MNQQEKRERMAAIVAVLEEVYPDAECALRYEGEPWKLLVMGRLSAQCTDARVNTVCSELFRLYPTASDLADAPLGDIENAIRSCGLYHTKAANIKDACRMICDEFGGELPREMDDLLRIPGVGRKIANLLRGDLWHYPAVVTDTHCIRICGKLGMYPKTLKDPPKIEKILTHLLEPEKSSDFCHRIVLLGREYCSARNPRCDRCPIKNLCEEGRKLS